MRVRPSILPCGIATPWPNPVEPNCSRSVRLARIAAESNPSRCPARLANCCSSERLLPPGRLVLIASKSRKSARCMVGLVTRRGKSHLAAGLWKMVSTTVWLNPADVAVFAPVDHVELARAAVLEHEGGGVAKVHQHNRIGHARLGNVD